MVRTKKPKHKNQIIIKMPSIKQGPFEYCYFDIGPYLVLGILVLGFLNSGPCWDRTNDPQIMSLLL